MSSSKYSLYSPINLLVFSSCMALIVIVDVTFIAPKILRSHELLISMYPLDERADILGEFGYWWNSRQTLYASFVLPPIIGFALAITLRQYIRKLLLRNQQHFRKEMRRPLLRWDGLGLKELREDISSLPQLFSIVPQFLPLLTVIIFLYVLDSLVFPDPSTSAPAFLATCGFITYGTWKRIFGDATSLESTD